MNTLIIVSGIIVALAGVCLASWSYIDTRKKYYYEFMKRKSANEKFPLS